MATRLVQVNPDPDPVNHPPHYTSDPSGVECIEITRHRTFNVGNAIKYLWRAGLKGDAERSPLAKQIEDLEKAGWYIADEIERLRAEGEKGSVDDVKPPQPAPPTGQSRLGQMTISWSGLTADGRSQPLYSHGEVMMATTATGTAVAVGQVDALDDAYVVPAQPFGVPRWFSIVGVAPSGKRSDESARIVLETQPIVDQLLGRAIGKQEGN